MVTSQEMRSFAGQCLRWSDETDNASHRDLMIQIARSWITTAAMLERRTDMHDDVLPDLRTKLN